MRRNAGLRRVASRRRQAAVPRRHRRQDDLLRPYRTGAEMAEGIMRRISARASCRNASPIWCATICGLHGAADAPRDAQADARRGRLRRVAGISRMDALASSSYLGFYHFCAARSLAFQPRRFDLAAPAQRRRSDRDGLRAGAAVQSDPQESKICNSTARWPRASRRSNTCASISPPPEQPPEASRRLLDRQPNIRRFGPRSRSTASTSTPARARFTSCWVKTARARPR